MQTISALSSVRPVRLLAQRFARRHFAPLAHAPKAQGRTGQAWRLLMRASGVTNGNPQQANRWLMRTMARECRRLSVSAVHAYEDCSLWQFLEAKRLGKACVYDLPTCYYPAWQRTKAELSRHYAEWLRSKDLDAEDAIRIDYKHGTCGFGTRSQPPSRGPEVITPDCGRILPNGELDCLVELLRWFDRHRHEIPEMSRAGGALDMGEIS
jgi:hypothetical protein